MNFTFGFLATNPSSNSSVETAGSLAYGNHDVETAGSLACLDNGGGFDSFGSKDLFGNVDFSNMDNSFFANASSVETAGSLACADFGASAGFDFGGASSGGDFGGGACASVGADCGSSCGGGSFSSVC